MTPEAGDMHLRSTDPIMLMHGFGAFLHVLSPVSLTPLVKNLRSQGLIIVAPLVPPYSTVPVRTQAWKEHFDHLLSDSGARKIHLIGLSSGGLDARYLVHMTNAGDRVASLTTISTPHRGSSIADAILERPDRIRKWLVALANWMGQRVSTSESDAERALEELTPAYLNDRFNPMIEDVEGIRYQSWAGQAGIGTSTPINPVLKPTNRRVFEHEGVNDGIVSVNSARWTGFRGVIEADHGRQIGIKAFNGSFDAAAFIAGIATMSTHGASTN